MRGYSHLSDDEREQIGLLKVLGHSIGAIARAIRRPKSTISRELSRNRLPSGRYSLLHAAGAYQLRRRSFQAFSQPAICSGVHPSARRSRTKLRKARSFSTLHAVGCETIYAFIIKNKFAFFPAPRTPERIRFKRLI